MAQRLGEGVDKTRRTEMKTLASESLELLKGSKFDWLANSEELDNRSRREFMKITRMSFKTSSVVRHNWYILSNLALARVTFSRMSDADLVQINGLGFSLCASKYS